MVTELTILSRFCNKNVSEHELLSFCLTSGKGSSMVTPARSQQKLCFKHQAESGTWCPTMSTCSLRNYFLQSALGKGHVALQSLQLLCTVKILRKLLASLARKFERPLRKKGLILHRVEGPQWQLLRNPQPIAIPSKAPVF